MTRQEAEAILTVGTDGRAMMSVLKNVPADLDPKLVATVVHARDWAKYFARLPAPVIREYLTLNDTRSRGSSVFLRSLVANASDENETCASWSLAVQTLKNLDTTYAWGSKQRKAKLRAVAQNPRLLSAVQAVVVASENPLPDMLAVLFVDGSESSVDALMPHFTRATRDRSTRLDWLARMKLHATDTPAMRAMLDEVDRLLSARNDESPAMELARHIGFSELKVFWFAVYFGSVEQRLGGVARVQGHLTVDSRHARWLSVYVSEENRITRFSEEKLLSDQLHLGVCTAAELPTWLATVARTMNCEWNFAAMAPRSNLRGARRARLVEWLSKT